MQSNISKIIVGVAIKGRVIYKKASLLRFQISNFTCLPQALNPASGGTGTGQAGISEWIRKGLNDFGQAAKRIALIHTEK